jgi:hypothetical protein
VSRRSASSSRKVDLRKFAGRRKYLTDSTRNTFECELYERELTELNQL